MTTEREALTADRPLMCVDAPQLFQAAEEMDARGSTYARLSNGVAVTPAQLRAAAEILQDSPKPQIRGFQPENMTGFIDRMAQPSRGSLVFHVGILPSRTYRITKRGKATEVEA